MKLLLVGGEHHGKVLEIEKAFNSIKVCRVSTLIGYAGIPPTIEDRVIDEYVKYRTQTISYAYIYYVPLLHDSREINRLLHTLHPNLLQVAQSLFQQEQEQIESFLRSQPQPQILKLKDITSLMKDSADNNPDAMLERILAKGRRYMRLK